MGAVRVICWDMEKRLAGSGFDTLFLWMEQSVQTQLSVSTLRLHSYNSVDIWGLKTWNYTTTLCQFVRQDCHASGLKLVAETKFV